MLTMNSHGDEFSIAGGVEGIIRDPNPMAFVFSFFFFIICVVLSTTGNKDYVQR